MLGIYGSAKVYPLGNMHVEYDCYSFFSRILLYLLQYWATNAFVMAVFCHKIQKLVFRLGSLSYQIFHPRHNVESLSNESEQLPELV